MAKGYSNHHSIPNARTDALSGRPGKKHPTKPELGYDAVRIAGLRESNVI